MDDFGILARDFGFKPQGKSAPMASSKAGIGVGSDGGDHRARSSSSSVSFLDDQNRDGLLFSDVFGGPPKYISAAPTNATNNRSSSSPLSDFDYDSIFKSSSTANEPKIKSSSSPVYDKPVYDDDVDIFEGLPGLKSKSVSSSARFDEDVFPSMSPTSKQSAPFDDLLGNLGRTERRESKNSKSSRDLDDLIPGFGGNSRPANRPISESNQPQKATVSSNKTIPNVMEDPFVVLGSTSTPAVSSQGLFSDPLEEISKLSNSANTKSNGSSVSGGVFDDLDPLNGFGKSVPSFSSEINNRGKDRSPSRTGSGTSGTQSFSGKEPIVKSSFKTSESHPQKKMSVDSFSESHQTLFNMPTTSMDSQKSVGQTASIPSFGGVNSNETSSQVDTSPRSDEPAEASDDVWLTVSDIPLFTQPTSAPPPSRPPPPRPPRASKSEMGSFASNARKKGNKFSSPPSSTQYSESPRSTRPTVKSTTVSQIDELEDFAMGRAQNVDEPTEVHSDDEVNMNSADEASAAMKEAMDRAEAKFRHAKEVKGREYARVDRTKEAAQLEKDEQTAQDAQDREFRENQERLDRERRQKEREEEEREQRRHEKERERLREIERERKKVQNSFKSICKGNFFQPNRLSRQ